MQNSDPNPDLLFDRKIRTYAKRVGRVTKAQRQAIEAFYPNYGLPVSSAPLDLKKIFENSNPVIMDIGFGNGASTSRMALAASEKNFLAVEVYSAGIGSLLKTIATQNIQNVRVIQHDALEVLREMIPDASLAGFHIFFPDPWPKKKHHKRRLISPENTKLLCQKLAPGGVIHTATDWAAYVEEMLEIFEAEPNLKNRFSSFAPRPDSRPITPFERRALAEGRKPRDLIFERI